MPIASVESDPVALTLTAIGEYPVPVERLWKAWADPRQLERFWGPPTWPATFTRHDMKAGGRSEYFMSGPNGEISRGYWDVLAVQAPEMFEVQDGFADAGGKGNDALPSSRMRIRFEATEAGSRFVAVSTFASLEAMEQLLAMGMIEGMNAALAQMDEVLADLAEASASYQTALEVIDDTHAVVTRVVRGSLEQVWRAHHEAALVQQWMLGPDGWTMPVCDVAQAVGEHYRYEWESADGENRFGFVGELLEVEAPRREVSTEQMIGMEGPGNRNELLLVPQPGGRTRIELRITYPSKEVQDLVLGSGMVDGMEASYARMEAVLAGS